MKMVDVGEKDRTPRVAVARGELRCTREALKLLNEGRLEKGDALAAARLAGIQGVKRAPDLIPLCHPISVSGADVEVAADEEAGGGGLRGPGGPGGRARGGGGGGPPPPRGP